ncbi:MAG: hypothetical protein WAM82_09380 [Thermoanaerobaculia bacterium]
MFVPVLPRMRISVFGRSSFRLIGIGPGVENRLVKKKVPPQEPAITVRRILTRFAEKIREWAATLRKYTSSFKANYPHLGILAQF